MYYTNVYYIVYYCKNTYVHFGFKLQIGKLLFHFVQKLHFISIIQNFFKHAAPNPETAA